MALGKPARTGSRAEAQERLLVQAAQKDPAHFAELYENNFERVYAYIVGRVRDRHVAEDFTSEVFHKALAALPNFDWRGIPFAAWLFRIAANIIADSWKASSKEILEDPPEQASSQQDLDEVERRAELFRLASRLPKEQGRVIEMRFAEGKSIREISAELNRSEGAVKQLQFRALETLRHKLGMKSGSKNG
jgi:RNA polymerase sigma-70 factor, ECF subfamily